MWTRLPLFLLCLVFACDRPAKPPPESTGPTPDAGPPWQKSQREPAVPKGMIWIPGGALVAGTPPDRYPRMPDVEMPGHQVILKGFFMDAFPYPNEAGAIPQTNVTHAEARALCETQGKRLCTELEWERACKGPENTTYEYGDEYRAEVCATGAAARMRPSGLSFGCRSGFGVRDLHGGAWEWTDSPWGRGKGESAVAVRGGNASYGDVVGRCAHAESRRPSQKSGDLGFRCCKGERNAAEVTLQIEDGPKLQRLNKVDAMLAADVADALPEEAKKELLPRGKPHWMRQWIWRPVGNEKLSVLAGCAGDLARRRCGVLVVRRPRGRLDVVGWAPSGRYIPVARLHGNPRDLWVYGGDVKSHYRRLVGYRWGRIRLGKLERNIKLAGKR